MNYKPMISALGLAFALCGNAHALASTGSLSGWNVTGDAAASAGAITVTTAYLDAAGDQAYNLSGVSAADIFSLTDAVGLDVSAFDIGGEFATEGSLVSQSFATVAGQTLSFDWSFTTHETRFLDNAFLAIGGNVISLADTALPGSGLFSYVFSQSGPVTLAFGVVDTTDTDGVSLLSVSNLALSPVAAVPEPATTALMLLGLGVVGAVAARRRAA